MVSATKYGLVLIASLCLSVSASLAQVPVPSTDLSTIPSGDYRLDPTHVSIVFSISHYGFSQLTGTFDRIEGELEFNAHVPIDSRLRIAVDASSADANNEMLETLLAGQEFLDAGAYPEIIFQSNNIDVTGPASGQITGMLTIRGMSHPVTLDATLNGYGTNGLTLQRTLGFSATTTLSRAQWGMTAFPTMLGDEIFLRIEVEFLKRNFGTEDDDSVFD